MKDRMEIYLTILKSQIIKNGNFSLSDTLRKVISLHKGLKGPK